MRTTALRVLTAATAAAAAVAAVPAGAAYPGSNGAMVVSSDRNNDFGLYSRTTSSTGEVTYTKLAHGGTEPAYSPNGQLIAYASGVYSDESDIVVMNADGTGQRRVTTAPGAETDPTWSPDGTRIAFTAVVGSGRKANREIFTVDALGTEAPVNITNNPADDYWPAWSASGLLAFVSDRDRQDVYTMTANGGSVTALNLARHHPRWPAWSPDGESLVFAGKGALHLRSASGAVTQLTDGPGHGMPVWSPDGTQILFRQLSQQGNTFEFRLYTVEPRAGATPVLISDGNGNDYMADWQPIPSTTCPLAALCI